MDKVSIKIVKPKSDLYKQALELRNRILREPIGLTIYQDDLSDEPKQHHIVAIYEDKVVGVVVMKVENNIAKLRQMTVEPDYQGKGIGAVLVQYFEKHASNLRLSNVKLHARHHAVGFYERLGYHKTSRAPFQEVGMEHFEMEKEL